MTELEKARNESKRLIIALRKIMYANDITHARNIAWLAEEKYFNTGTERRQYLIGIMLLAGQRFE